MWIVCFCFAFKIPILFFGFSIECLFITIIFPYVINTHDAHCMSSTEARQEMVITTLTVYEKVQFVTWQIQANDWRTVRKKFYTKYSRNLPAQTGRFLLCLVFGKKSSYGLKSLFFKAALEVLLDVEGLQYQDRHLEQLDHNSIQICKGHWEEQSSI